MDTVYGSSGEETVKLTVELELVNYCRHLRRGGVGERECHDQDGAGMV